MKRAGTQKSYPLLDELRQALATDKRIAQHKTTSLAVRHKVFVMVVDDKLVMKLPATTIAALVDAGTATPWGMGGRVMKEWVQVNATRATERLALAKEAIAFVAGPPPKVASKTKRSIRPRSK